MFKHYTMNQVVLPLDLEIKLQENDIAYAVNDVVENIPDEAFASFLRATGCPTYNPRMMMKIILCAYTQLVFSGRKIEGLLKDSVRKMWLAQGYEPSYRTINRFRVDPAVKDLLRQCFVQFRCQLIQEEQIDDEAIFIVEPRSRRMPINTRLIGTKRLKNTVQAWWRSPTKCMMNYWKKKLSRKSNGKARMNYRPKNSQK